jgi:hypothetical protein
VIEGVGAPGGGRIVTRHVGEHVEAVTVRIHEGRSQARSSKRPGLHGGAGSGVGMLDIVRLTGRRVEGGAGGVGRFTVSAHSQCAAAWHSR